MTLVRPRAGLLSDQCIIQYTPDASVWADWLEGCTCTDVVDVQNSCVTGGARPF